MSHDNADRVKPGGAGPLLTASELAIALKKPRKQIHRLAELGQIPGYKIGRLWRFRLEEVLAACRVLSPEEDAERRLKKFKVR